MGEVGAGPDGKVAVAGAYDGRTCLSLLPQRAHVPSVRTLAAQLLIGENATIDFKGASATLGPLIIAPPTTSWLLSKRHGREIDLETCLQSRISADSQ